MAEICTWGKILRIPKLWQEINYSPLQITRYLFNFSKSYSNITKVGTVSFNGVESVKLKTEMAIRFGLGGVQIHKININLHSGHDMGSRARCTSIEKEVSIEGYFRYCAACSR